MLKCSDVATLTQIYQLKMMECSNHPDTTHNSVREGLKEIHSSGFFLQTLYVFMQVYTKATVCTFCDYRYYKQRKVDEV